MKMKKIFAAMAATAVSASAFAAMSLSTSAADVVGVAGLRGQAGTYNYWSADENSGTVTVKDAQIDGNAQYEAVWDIEGDGTGSIEFFMLEIKETESLGNAFTKDTFPDLSITVDELYIDGQKVDFTQKDSAYDLAYYESDTKRGSRAYFVANWGVNDGNDFDLDEATPITSQVKVYFTVSGLYNDGTSNVTPVEVSTEAPTEAPTEAATTSADTTKAGDTKTTTKKDDSKSTTKAADGGSKESATSTGDAGVGIALGVIGLAAATAFVVRKKD